MLNDDCPTLKVDAKSNLPPELLKDITYTSGFEYTAYEEKASLIDEELLKSRNEITHSKSVLL